MIYLDTYLDYSWTRDPLDRIIVANANLNNDTLVTKDENILKNYERAIWYCRLNISAYDLSIEVSIFNRISIFHLMELQYLSFIKLQIKRRD